MWGDQWIYRCGTHNFILREKCRDCGNPKKEAAVGKESWVEVMENVIATSERNRD